MKSCHLFPLILMLTLSSHIGAQNGQIKFFHITMEDGLSQSHVQSICKDSRGFLWFGTEDGLNRYDGNQIIVYRHDPLDPHSISHNYITDIIEDNQQTLWIGTRGGGLNRYDPVEDHFIPLTFIDSTQSNLGLKYINDLCFDSDGYLWIGYDTGGLIRYQTETGHILHYKTDENDWETVIYDDVWKILEDSRNNLWIATLGGGLDRFDRETGIFHHHVHDPDDPTSINSDDIWSLFEDSRGHLWVGTFGKGVNRYDYETGRFQHFQHDPQNPFSLSHDVVFAFAEDSSGHFWVGTEEGGLNRFDYETETFHAFTNEEYNENSLSHNSVETIYVDNIGTIWVGTYNGGVNYFHPQLEKFSLFTRQNGLSNNAVLSFLEDNDNSIWIGTDGGGLNRFTPKDERFSHYLHDPNDNSSLSHNSVLSLYKDHQNTFWIGTYAGGLNRFDPIHHTFTAYRHDPQSLESICSNDIRVIYEDSRQNFWVGTRFGLDLFRRNKNDFIHYQPEDENPRSLSHQAVYAILEDSRGYLWIGTQSGLNRFDDSINGFYRFYQTEEPGSLSNDNILTIFEDSRHFLWIGTAQGLNRFDYNNQTFKSFTTKEGLPNDVINAILEDNHGRLWISTNHGLSCFDVLRETFRNYSKTDGLQSNDFHYGTALKTRQGKMYFGGVNGFNVFHPDSLKDNPHIPPVHITGIRIMNQDSPHHQLEMRRHGRIILTHDESILTIQFSALNYYLPENNRYAYKLAPLQKEWIQNGSSSSATFTGLPHGTYTFSVKGSNNDGVWNETGASLSIIIKPPYWKALWFRLLLSILFLGSVASLFIIRTRSIHKRSRELASINEQLHLNIQERKKAEDLIRKSLNEKEILLKEIHHRVKNNLQVISSLLSLQSRSIDDPDLQDVFKDSQQRIRSMALVHEKLYQSENLSEIDFSGYIRSLTRNLFLAYQVDANRIKMNIDIQEIKLNIEQAIPFGLIINELVSNVFKHAFPPDWANGTVDIILKQTDEQMLELIVRDDGKGFNEDFDIRQAKSLGLKLLVVIVEDQLNGEFTVNSQQGTEFIIQCPVAEDKKRSS